MSDASHTIVPATKKPQTTESESDNSIPLLVDSFPNSVINELGITSYTIQYYHSFIVSNVCMCVNLFKKIVL
jgi:hypothetical protein